MFKVSLFILLILVNTGCEFASESFLVGEDRHVGGPCEGCEAALEFEYTRLAPDDTLPGAGVDAPLLKLFGTIYQNDGVTPASNVILYIHHTDRNGTYSVRNSDTSSTSLNARNKGHWAMRHGSLRGWVRTNATGQYSFLTQRPAPYPDDQEPAHIHMVIKEHAIAPYYIDDLLFADDDLLTDDHIDRLEGRGGPGIAKHYLENDQWVVKRDIILGMNIPGY